MNLVITVGMIQLAGAMLPGVDFALVVKNSLSRSRRAGVFTALGIATGLLVHLSYGFMGLLTLLKTSPTAFGVFKSICAAYLTYIGINLLRHPIDHIAVTASPEHTMSFEMDSWRAFREGFICNVFNPKAIVFFVSFFALILQSNPSTPMKFVYATEIIFVTFLWFSALALLITTPFFKNALGRAQKVISYGLAALLLLFAGSIFFGSH